MKVMISNSSYKLKASKSFRELNDYLDGEKEDVSEEDKEKDSVNSISKSYIDHDSQYGGRAQCGGMYKTRGKPYEYRSTRGSPADRRGTSWRGRGFLYRKYEHDVNNYHPKYETRYESSGINFLEDTRISKLIRRLSQENDEEKGLVLCKKLLEALIAPENSRYVRRAFSTVAEALFDISRHCANTSVRKQVSRALGRVAYVLDADLSRYTEWVFTHKYPGANDEVRVHLLSALHETLALEHDRPRLHEWRTELVAHVQGVLEATDSPEVFIAAVDALLALDEIWPDALDAHFTDTVDILLGWQVDGNQTTSVIEYVSKSLVRLCAHWHNNIPFALNLVGQFLEDVELYGEKLRQHATQDEDDTLDRITAWVRALATVLKCVPRPDLGAHQSFLTDCLRKVVRTVADALDSYVPDDLIIAANECVAVLLRTLQSRASGASPPLYALLEVELGLIHELAESALISVLLLTSTVIRELSTDLPAHLVRKLVSSDSDLVALRLAPSERVQCALADVYHSLLDLKNIPLLQEAYCCVSNDLKVSINDVCNEKNDVRCWSDAQLIGLFMVRALAPLANAASSIIGMWALRPGILELLADLKPQRSALAARAPALQHCLLRLLRAHSQCHGHFITSSSLVCGGTSDKLGASPSSGHLALILDTVRNALSAPHMEESTRLLVLRWLYDLVIASAPYLVKLATTPEFVGVLEALLRTAHVENALVALEAHRTLTVLLVNTETYPSALRGKLFELCIKHTTSAHHQVRKDFTSLLALVPWKVNRTLVYSHREVITHMRQGITEDILALQFKHLMRTLLVRGASAPSADYLRELYVCSSPLDTPDRTLILHSDVLLRTWATWNSALLCVNHKLRTPLGKPTDTFLAIETALKDLCKESRVDLVRAHMVLELLEHLEKAIYNAAEGCAEVLPAPSKPVRAFFHTNASTCREWLTRVRSAAAHSALRTMHPEAAIRHCHARLRDLQAQGESAQLDQLQDAVLTLASALLHLKQTDALRGLYVWWNKTAQNGGRKFSWLKAAAEHAAGNYEGAIASYRDVIIKNPELEDQQSSVAKFIQEQALRCYVSLGTCDELADWSQFENFAHDMSQFQGTMRELSDWGELHNKPTPDKAEIQLYRVALGAEDATLHAEIANLELGIQESVRIGAEGDLAHWLLLYHVAHSLRDSKPFNLHLDTENAKHSDPGLLTKALQWTRYFEKRQNFTETDSISALFVCAARTARKTGNTQLAERHLLTYINRRGSLISNNDDSLEFVARTLAKPENKSSWTHDDCKAALEIAKLLYCKEDNSDDRILAINVCAASASAATTDAKSLRTLAKWVRELPDAGPLREVNSALGRLVLMLPDKAHTSELAAGKLLQLAANSHRDCSKTWLALAEWCYAQGKLAVEASTPEVVLGEVRNALAPELADRIIGVLELCTEDDDGPLECLGSELRAEVSQLWTYARKRPFHHYELAADAYLRSVHAGGENSTCVAATLRLLRLVARHARELQEILDAGLAHTPTRAWHAIVPQLFSRLGHPQEYVRRRISQLLCRVAQDAPHLIVFPAVVGALEGGIHKIRPADCRLVTTNLDEEQPEEDCDADPDLDADNSNRDALRSGYTAVVDALRESTPEAVSQVQILVHELRRVSLLWDELWAGTLAQHHAEIAKRLAQLDSEITKTENDPDLTAEEKRSLVIEKQRVIMLPVLFLLEQLQVATGREPQTPYESQFRERFQHVIEDTVGKLRSGCDGWQQALRTLQCKLQQRATPRRAGAVLQLADMSPALGALRDSPVPMPGVAPGVTISRIAQIVHILPTKTRPKKLCYIGSNGRTYTYLLKGMEDLHLDERIMQLLCVANTLMNKMGDLYHAHHYAVIPLGMRAGLIQWVDGTTPLFSLYKRWQVRSASGSAPLRPSDLFYGKLRPILAEHGVRQPESRREWPAAALRQALLDLMAETPKDLLSKELWCGSQDAAAWFSIVNTYARSTAVTSVLGYVIGLGDRHLDNVLVDLRKGHVLHIDYNVCFDKGRQLRVPEKVPFRMTPNMEHALGVTGVEGVFRMTCERVLHTMQEGRDTLLTLLEAFVYDPLVDWTAGGEGLAGAALRAVAPSAASDVRLARRALERDVALSMFKIRRTEIRGPLQRNTELLRDRLQELSEQIRLSSEQRALCQRTADALLELHQQMTLLKEAEYHGREHPLYTLAERHGMRQSAALSEHSAKCALTQHAEQCEARLTAAVKAVSAARSSQQLSRWMHDLEEENDEEAQPPAHEIARDFLQSAGQSSVLAQCEQLDTELKHRIAQHRTAGRVCIDLLGQYGAIAGLLPTTHIETTRISRQLRYCRSLLEDLTPLSQTYGEIASQYDTGQPPEVAPRMVAHSCQLQTLLRDANASLQASYKRLRALETTPEHNVEDARSALVVFVQEPDASRAFELVSAGALCALNKRYLSLEAAAHSAGDYLVDLTSRDGVWFLDEMHLVSALISELSSHISSIPNDADDPTGMLLECLKAADNVYKGLHELTHNFHTIIVPETVKALVTEDPSVTAMMAEVNGLLLALGRPLPEVLVELERHLRYTVMEMESPHGDAQGIVRDVRARLERLLVSTQDQGPLTAGQMLLMGFSGLFDKLHVEWEMLAAACTRAWPCAPAAWRKVDQCREAKSLAAPVLAVSARSVLDDMFLLKRLQAMSEFLSTCRAAGGALDDDRLCKPVRRYCADYVARRLLGVLSHSLALTLCAVLRRSGLDVSQEVERRDIGAENKVPLDELCRRALETSNVPQSILAHASGLCGALETASRRKHSGAQIQNSVEVKRAALQRIQLQLAAYHWVHDDLLGLQHVPLARGPFLRELGQASGALAAVQARALEARDQRRALLAGVEQRLKWAAGANPDLVNSVLAAFERAVRTQHRRLDTQLESGTSITTTCAALLQHEALCGHTPDALSYDALFLQLLNACEASSHMQLACSEDLTSAEKGLIALLPLDGAPVDQTWIRCTAQKLSNMITDSQHQKTEQHEQLLQLRDATLSHVAELRGLVNSHHKLISEIRTLLRSYLKLEPGAADVQAFLGLHGKFIEELNAVLGRYGDCDHDEEQEVFGFEKLHQSATDVLQALMNVSLEAERPALVRQDAVKTCGEQRNVQASAVWHKVRLKLEGRDPDPGVKLTVQEQVEHVVKEATSLDNLALMYEGWTPWV